MTTKRRTHFYQFDRKCLSKWANFGFISFGERRRTIAYWSAIESIYSIWRLIIMSYSILNLRFDGQRTKMPIPCQAIFNSNKCKKVPRWIYIIEFIECKSYRFSTLSNTQIVVARAELMCCSTLKWEYDGEQKQQQK